jgi:hypothetical protein
MVAPSPWALRAACFLVVMAAAACRAEPPPLAIEGTHGSVRATSLESAKRGEEWVAALVPAIRAALPATRERTLDVWLQQEIELWRGSPYPGHVAGVADHARGRIHVRDGDAQLEAHLAHEIVHLLLEDSWRPLPAALEEGLCDFTACAVVERGAPTLRVWRLLEAAGALGGLDVVVEVRLPRGGAARARTETLPLRWKLAEERPLDLAATLALDDSELFTRSTEDGGSGIYGIGYFLVSRIAQRRGIEGLHGLCRSASREQRPMVPASWLLAAAGLTAAAADPQQLRAELASEFDGRDLPEIAALIADVLADEIVAAGRVHWPGVEGVELMRAARPFFGLAGSRVRLPLVWSERVVAAVIERHDAPREAPRAEDASAGQLRVKVDSSHDR